MVAGPGWLHGAMTTTITPVDPRDETALVAWNELMRRGYTEGREATWWRSPAATVAQFTSPRPGRASVLLLAHVDGQPVGGAEANWDPDEPVDLEVSVLPEYRRRGVGRALVAAVRAALPPQRLVQSEVYCDEGVAFAQAMGLEVGNREARQLLDWPVARASIDALDRSPDGLEVRSWVGRCPDDLVDDMVSLTQQMHEDVPVGDLTRSAREASVAEYRLNEQRMAAAGYRVLTSLARLHGRPAGYTQLYVDTNAAIALQDDTLVERAARGRGIGRALKAANLRQLAGLPEAAEVRWVQSYTAPDSEPMIELNWVVGFRIVDVMTALEGVLRHP